ncbi:MAG: hypothetical protein K8S54_15200 [Spirochaetia bacterium]|nr:hypothetical protein [Spirochaetia bacterium]
MAIVVSVIMYRNVFILLLTLAVSNCIKLASSPTDLSTLLTVALGSTSSPGSFVAFSATTNLLAKSSGDGTWVSSTFTGAARITRAAMSDSTIIGLDGSTVGTAWRSSDGGLTWASVGGMGAAVLQQVAACGSNVLVLPLAGSSVTGYFSSNGGMSFSAVTVESAGTFTLGYATCINNVFYVSYGGSSTNVERSTNGSTWTPASTPPATSPMIMSGSGSSIYGVASGTGTAFTRSTDGGVTFGAGESVASFQADFAGFGGATVMNGVAYTALWNQGPQCLFRRSNFGMSGASSNILGCTWATSSSQVRRMVNTAGILIAAGNLPLGGGASNGYVIYRSTNAGTTFAAETLPTVFSVTGLFGDVVVVP